MSDQEWGRLVIVLGGLIVTLGPVLRWMMGRISKLEQANTELQGKLEKAENRDQQREKELNALRPMVGLVQLLKDDLESSNQKIADLTTKVNDLSESQAESQKREAGLEAQIATLITENNKLASENHDLMTQVKSFERFAGWIGIRLQEADTDLATARNESPPLSPTVPPGAEGDQPSNDTEKKENTDV